MSDSADTWRDRLSDYLDDALEVSERSELEEHLEGCEECRETLVELRQVVARAGRLVDAPPARDLWPEIAYRIRETEEGERHVARAVNAKGGTSLAGRRGKSFTFSMPQLAAAAVTLVALSSGVAWQIAGGFSARQAEPAAPVAQAPAKADLLLASRIANNDYESAIAQLERVLEVGRERLDTATVRKVEEKLALIDKAIDEARQALSTDPSNAYLNRHLAGTMRRKLDLLRRTAALTEL
jgi:tetratricopeptide (TPR) repeat protein